MRAKPVAADEQYRLIMECRSSGLTDYQWCMEHDIKPGTFYNWVKRLRQKGYANVPSASKRGKPVRQEVVKINTQAPSIIVMEPEAVSEPVSCPASVISELPVLELSMAGATVRIPHGTDTIFLEQLIRILGRTLC